MIVTNLVMSDERATLLQFPPRYGLSIESASDPFWRLGDVIPLGKPFPVLVERGLHPTKHQLPVKGFEAKTDQPGESETKLARALIPVNGIFLKSSTDGGREALDLVIEQKDECAFIVAFAEPGSRPGLYTSVTGLRIPSEGREGEWIDWEPMVVFGQQAAGWLLRQLGAQDLTAENEWISERLARLDQR